MVKIIKNCHVKNQPTLWPIMDKLLYKLVYEGFITINFSDPPPPLKSVSYGEKLIVYAWNDSPPPLLIYNHLLQIYNFVNK